MAQDWFDTNSLDSLLTYISIDSSKMNSEKANDGGSKMKSSGGDTDNNETPNPMFRVITSKFKGKFEE